MGRVRTLLGISVFWIPLSMLGDGVTTLVVPQRLSAFSDPGTAATAVGLVTFAGLLAGMLVQPAAGAVSDALRPRWGRRAVLLAGTALVVAALAAFAIADGILGLLIAFVLLQAAAGVAQAAQQGFIPDLVPAAWRGRAAGAKGLADLGGAFFGFLLLGALLAGGDAVPAAIGLMVVVVIAAVVTIALVPERTAVLAPRGSISLGRAYAIDLRAHGVFVRVVVVRFLFLLGTFAVGRFLLLFVADRLGIDPATAGDEAGALLAALTLITAVAALPGGWVADRFGRGRTMIAGAMLSTAGAALLSTAGSSGAIILFGGLMAIGSAAFSSANWAMAADLVPEGRAGNFLGLANIGTAGAAAAAGLFGPLADGLRTAVPDLGYGGVFVVAAVPLALSAVLASPLTRTTVRRSGAGADPPPVTTEMDSIPIENRSRP